MVWFRVLTDKKTYEKSVCAWNVNGMCYFHGWIDFEIHYKKMHFSIFFKKEWEKGKKTEKEMEIYGDEKKQKYLLQT